MDRKYALEILLKYEKDKSYLNITLNHVLSSHNLSRESKDFITQMVYGTIQNRIYLEYQLAPFVKGKRVKPYERMLLLMSLYQHYYLNRIPDYAIQNEAVNLSKKEKGINTSAFINAVLNHAFKQKQEVEGSEAEKLSIITSHPLWLVNMLIKQYDEETTKKICEEDNLPPCRVGRVNTLKINRDDLIHEDHRFSKSEICEDAVYFKGGNIANTEAFKEGKVTIQDESSQFVAHLLKPNKDDYVLDMCCAPGSKTTHLAALMENKGIIEAYDLFSHKISLVNDNCKRLGVTNIHTHVGDSTQLSSIYKPETFTKILLDGPCSGLGVLKRKPEIKYHDSSIMDEIIPLQQKLLENAYVLLQKGGKIVYSTCTINKKENEKQIQLFTKNHPDMKVIKERTILPFEYHSDGFYMCLMEKDKL